MSSDTLELLGSILIQSPRKLKGYQKHFFWLGEEPVESASLLSYTRNEKSGQGHHNASWATQTGKGVLFYSKREEDKATPAGLIMLVSDMMLLCRSMPADQ